ncbi:DUF2783 domain-containing protein [Cognatishimia sp. SS12]|uniref:DUF2783 domain-containing protein n=1 Tax=Cognatishimia sp. SS12 TaxID=2979465 RepID=UPI00232DDEFC|nr:DUF2783 domain-containing protein [Cognatishimia sp. SS12]MDC0739574.1 DUF2783 domain-containing protein [Cognatishimia sp. SS12]
MPRLITTPNIGRADAFYERLIDVQDSLSEEESQSYNARLILILANHIGELGVLEQALEAAQLKRP